MKTQAVARLTEIAFIESKVVMLMLLNETPGLRQLGWDLSKYPLGKFKPGSTLCIGDWTSQDQVIDKSVIIRTEDRLKRAGWLPTRSSKPGTRTFFKSIEGEPAHIIMCWKLSTPAVDLETMKVGDKYICYMEICLDNGMLHY